MHVHSLFFTARWAGLAESKARFNLHGPGEVLEVLGRLIRQTPFIENHMLAADGTQVTAR
jgi:hypothetical protein